MDFSNNNYSVPRKVCAKCGSKHYEHEMYLVDFGVYKKEMNICSSCILSVVSPPGITYPGVDRSSRGYDLKCDTVRRKILAQIEAYRITY